MQPLEKKRVFRKMHISSKIVKQILLRLPVKSTLKFRSVRKSWCKFLKHDNFVEMHLRHTIEKSNSKLLFTSDLVRGVFTIDYDPSSSLCVSNEVVEMVDYPFKGEDIKIFGSCNGVFFIKIYGDIATGLWNPATKEYKVIPLPETPIGFTNMQYSPRICYRVDSQGFGYDHSINDYKLVTIVSPSNKEIMVSEVEVYTMGSNSWRRIDYIPYKITGQTPGVFVDGALHWLANPCPMRSNNEFSKVLLSFNLAEEVFTEVPQLEVFDDNNKFEHKRIDVVEGLLTMLCSHSKVGFEVWVMNDYGVRDSWTKRYTISRPEVDVVPSFKYLRRIQSLRNGEVLLEIQLEDVCKYAALVIYDPKHERARMLKIDLGKYDRWGRQKTSHLTSRFYTETYMESLVSLHSGTYVGGGQEESDLDEALEGWGSDGWDD